MSSNSSSVKVPFGLHIVCDWEKDFSMKEKEKKEKGKTNLPNEMNPNASLLLFPLLHRVGSPVYIIYQQAHFFQTLLLWTQILPRMSPVGTK